MLRAYFTYVDSIYLFADMFPAHVSAYIRYVFSAIMTVRTIEPWRLATLKFRVIIKIVLVTENTRACRTWEFLLLDGKVANNTGLMMHPMIFPCDGHEFKGQRWSAV